MATKKRFPLKVWRVAMDGQGVVLVLVVALPKLEELLVFVSECSCLKSLQVLFARSI